MRYDINTFDDTMKLIDNIDWKKYCLDLLLQEEIYTHANIMQIAKAIIKNSGLDFTNKQNIKDCMITDVYMGCCEWLRSYQSALRNEMKAKTQQFITILEDLTENAIIGNRMKIVSCIDTNSSKPNYKTAYKHFYIITAKLGKDEVEFMLKDIPHETSTYTFMKINKYWVDDIIYDIPMKNKYGIDNFKEFIYHLERISGDMVESK